MEKLDVEENTINDDYSKDKIVKSNIYTIVNIAKSLEEKKLKDGIIKENTFNRNMQIIKTYDNYTFSSKPIGEVAKEQIEEFLESERVKSNSTLNKEYSILKRVYEYADYKKLIKENFFVGYERLKLPKSYKENKDVVALTSREEFILKEYMKKHPNKYNNIILLCLYTGMRIGEVLALTKKDISFDKEYGTIDVNKSLTRNLNGEIVMGKTTKTKNGKRKLALIPKSRKVVDKILKEMKPNKYNALFLRPDGKLYTDNQVNRSF